MNALLFSISCSERQARYFASFGDFSFLTQDVLGHSTRSFTQEFVEARLVPHTPLLLDVDLVLERGQVLTLHDRAVFLHESDHSAYRVDKPKRAIVNWFLDRDLSRTEEKGYQLIRLCLGQDRWGVTRQAAAPASSSIGVYSTSYPK